MDTSTRRPKRRQAIRKLLLLLSFIAFPVTMNFFSPYLIVDGAFKGIASGSGVVFASMFVGSMVFGRLWCGWACPAAGLQEPVIHVNPARVARRVGIVKWAIWGVWVSIIVFGVVRAGGYHAVDPLYMTEGGISVAPSAGRPIVAAYAIYFIVVLVFVVLAATLGRRGGCHALCWMAPFMILGRGLRNRLGAWPSLLLAARPEECTRCGRCTRDCPMSIDVERLVHEGAMEHADCALCGSCIDGCPGSVIRYTFGPGR